MSSQSSSRSSQYSKEDFSGSSYTLILSQILSCPGTYELPLRTMYALNSTPRAQCSRPATPTTPLDQPGSPTFPSSALAAAQFQNSLVNQITNLPSQPSSLPPSFITSFVSKCFPSELAMVDFPQGLTALDYLKDLEIRRRREMKAALSRLGIDETVIKTLGDPEGIAKRHPGVAAWIKTNEENERRVEAYYTQLYIALRRWILINELSLMPFSKHNNLALLNTLYPPLPPGGSLSATPAQPTAMLTSQILRTQRDGFFEYIRRVEKSGPEVLEPLMQQGRRKPRVNSNGEVVEDATGWPAAKDCLDAYLRTCNYMIEDARSVQSYDDFDSKGKRRPSRDSSRQESRAGRKADSGVSFTSNDPSKRRPSTGSSAGKDKSNAPTPSAYQTQFPASAKSSGTALEKIARSIKQIRSKRSATVGSKSRPGTPHFRDHSDGSAQTLVDEPPRPQSRAGSFVRSISRIRQGRSRSRPGTPAQEDPMPPTPTIPQSFMDYDDDDEEEGRGRLRRSLSMSRSKSASVSKGKLLKKVKSMSDTKGTKEDRGRSSERVLDISAPEAFDQVKMRRQREQWEAKEQSKTAGSNGQGHPLAIGNAM